jgi:hypothetical protein
MVSPRSRESERCIRDQTLGALSLAPQLPGDAPAHPGIAHIDEISDHHRPASLPCAHPPSETCAVSSSPPCCTDITAFVGLAAFEIEQHPWMDDKPSAISRTQFSFAP